MFSSRVRRLVGSIIGGIVLIIAMALIYSLWPSSPEVQASGYLSLRLTTPTSRQEDSYSVQGVPTGDGDRSGTWSPVPSSPGALYSKVDETIPNDADYITGSAVGRCLFTFTPFSIPNDAYRIALRIYYRVGENVSGANNARASLKIGGSYYDSDITGVDPTTTPTTYTDLYQTNPRTGLPWNRFDANGSGGEAPLQQFGINTSDASPTFRVYMVYAEFTYEEPGIGIESIGDSQPLLGGAPSSLSQNPQYNFLMGSDAWTSVENERAEVIPAAGTLSRFFVKLSGAPNNGAGTQGYIFTVRVNSSNSSLSVNISETSTAANDSVHTVAVVPGDVVSIIASKVGAPVTVSTSWSSLFIGSTAGESICMGTSISFAGSQYISLTGKGIGTNENQSAMVMPTSGSFTSLYVSLSVDPGTSPDSYRIDLRRSMSISTNIVVVVVADNTSGVNTGNSSFFSTGEFVDLRIIQENTPSAAPYIAWGMKFVASIEGESLLFGSSLIDSPNSASTNYDTITGSYSVAWSVTETLSTSLSQNSTVKKFYARSYEEIGVNKFRQFDIREHISNTGVFVNLSTQYRVPTSDESNTGTFINYLGGATPLYAYVNKTAVSDSTWILGQTNGGGHATFNFSVFSASNSSYISNLGVVFRYTDDTSGTNKIASCLKVGGTYYTGALVEPPFGSNTTTTQYWTFNPQTNLPWTSADINGTGSNPLQAFGVDSNDYNPDVRVMMVYIFVNVIQSDTTHTYSLTDGQITGIRSLPVGSPSSIFPVWSMVLYIAPSQGGGEPDITNTPGYIGFGVIGLNATHWSYNVTLGYSPTFPLDPSKCYFTLTNTGTGTVNVSINGSNFSGGVGWSLNTSQGVNQAVLKAGYANLGSINQFVTLNTSLQIFISGMVTGNVTKWELALYTPTQNTDGVPKSSLVYLVASTP